MKSKYGCGKIGVGLILSLGLVAVCTLLFFGYASYQQKELREKYMPPTILVTDPAPGATVATGNYLNVSATAIGAHPIVRVELWLDGQLMETLTSAQPTGSSPFYANFSVLIPSDGPHMIFVYAVDSQGIIGQSDLMGLAAQTVASFVLVAAQDGESLNDIATANGTTPETVQALNPGVGSQPPAGTQVKVPLAPQTGTTDKTVLPSANSELVSVNGPMLLMLPQVPSGGGFLLPLFDVAPIPAKPTNLAAKYTKCTITLSWKDNADNEKYYLLNEVYQNSSGQARVTAPRAVSPSADPGKIVHIEYQPKRAGIYSFSVQAANTSNGQIQMSQPSNSVWVYIPADGCVPSKPPDRLVVEIYDVTLISNYQNVYCYASLENIPEQRVPLADNTFFKPEPDGRLAQYEMPVPVDGALEVTGKCLGWASDRWGNNKLFNLGRFDGQLPRATWNGKIQTVQGESYKIGVLAYPITETELIAATDPTLPMPYDLAVKQLPTSPGAPVKKWLRWELDGDPSKVTYFQLFLDGKHVATVNPDRKGNSYSLSLSMPGECGETLRWQVAAGSWTSISALSAPFVQELPPCQMYLRVVFDTIELDSFHADTDNRYPCDYDLYFKVSVREVTRRYDERDCGGGVVGCIVSNKLSCGIHSIADLAEEPAPFAITIPLSPGENVQSIPIHMDFYDDNFPCCDDPLFVLVQYPTLAPEQAGPSYRWSECSVSVTTTPAFKSNTASSRITYSYAYYPNKCADLPPELRK